MPIPSSFLGAMAALANLGAIHFMGTRVDTGLGAEIGRTLAYVSLAILGLTFWFAATGHVWVAIGIHVVLHPLRVVSAPLTTTWVNQHASSGVRAKDLPGGPIATRSR